MQTQSEAQRQMLGCGFAPQPEEARRKFVSFWDGGSLPNYKGPKMTVCPGYSTQLPEVIETVRAHRHWSKGAWGVRDLGAPLTLAIEIFEGAANEFQSWSMTSESEGGGRRER
jgi:hypothetical protein